MARKKKRMKENEADYTHYIPPEGRGLTEERSQELEMARKKIKTGDWEHFTPDFVGTKSQQTNVADLARQVGEAQRIFVEGRLSQPEGRVRIKTDLPVAIVHLGDLHLGSIYTDTKEVLRKFEKVMDTPNMYCVLMSNLIDNAIPSQFPSNMLSNGIPPDKQVMMMRHIAEELNGKGKLLAAVTSPCHEGWTYKHTGQDINALIFGFKGRKFPILENGGRLYVQVGKQHYLGALYHQVGPFESNFNETHALRQLNRLQQGMEPDWLAGAHRHVATAQVVYEGTGEYRKPVAYIRTGTEKGTAYPHDQFSVDRYGSTGEPTGQTIHLWAKEKRIDATCEFDTAVLAHEAYYLLEWARKK
jgi:hypothetical protein